MDDSDTQRWEAEFAFPGHGQNRDGCWFEFCGGKQSRVNMNSELATLQ